MCIYIYSYIYICIHIYIYIGERIVKISSLCDISLTVYLLKNVSTDHPNPGTDIYPAHEHLKVEGLTYGDPTYKLTAVCSIWMLICLYNVFLIYI
jgi:hypothetical protein